MPLFGSKHKHDHDNDDSAFDNRQSNAHGTHAAHGTHGTHGHGAAGELPPTGGVGSGVGVPMGSSAGMTQTYPGSGTQGTNMTGGTGHHTGHAGGMNDPYTAGGVGNTGYSTASGPGGANIPATSDLNHNQHNLNNHGAGTNSTGGGTGTRLTGKVESAMGSVLGSSALKAKGMEKEREANSVKLQGQELAEAERLEKEALMRRERAVGHGAHPANASLGAGGMSGNMGQNTGSGY